MKGGIHETSNLFGFAKLLKFDNIVCIQFSVFTLWGPSISLSLSLSLPPPHPLPSSPSLCELSPGQTDSQVLASSGKLNLRRDLRWMAKRTGMFPRKCTKVAKKKSYFKATGSVTELALTWVGWPNGKKLALTCGQI